MNSKPSSFVAENLQAGRLLEGGAENVGESPRKSG